MDTQIRRITVEEFDVLAERHENADKILEYIGGEIIEVPSNRYASKLSSRCSGYFFVYFQKHDIGHLTGEAGGFMVSGERYAPDVAITLKSKQSEVAKSGYDPVPPDLVIEVDFPSTAQSRYELSIKIANYLAAGTRVWVCTPEKKRFEDYAPGQPVKIIDIDGVLTCEDILPGFTLAVKDIFAE